MNQRHFFSTTQGSILIVLLIPLVFILLAAGYFVMSNQEKKQLGTLVSQQVSNFKTLEKTHQDIVDLINQNGSTNDAEKKSLLKAYSDQNSQNSNVLGIEDNPTIQQERKLIELYKKGSEQAKKIRSTNDEIEKKLNSPFFIFSTFKQGKDLVDKTRNFAGDIDGVYTYLDKIQQVGIKSIQLGVDIGTQIGIALRDPNATSQLEQKVKEYGNLEGELPPLPKNSSDVLTKFHNDQIKTIQQDKAVFNDLLTALQNRDSLAFRSAWNQLIATATSESNNSKTQAVNVFQNEPTFRSIDSLNKNWEEFQKSI